MEALAVDPASPERLIGQKQQLGSECFGQCHNRVRWMVKWLILEFKRHGSNYEPGFKPVSLSFAPGFLRFSGPAHNLQVLS
jgi:hypothetical protein